MESGGKNYMSSLNEHCQKNKLSLQFEVVNTKGPDHIKTFTIRAVVNNEPYPDGVGRNKKEAHQNAAKNALSCLQKDEPVGQTPNQCSSDSSLNFTQANYTCWLNEYSMKNTLTFKAIETIKSSHNLSTLYACKFICGDKEFPEAEGRGKKEAKEAAAKLVYEELLKENTEGINENGNGPQNTNILALSSSLSHLSLDSSNNTESNFIGHINHYCQKAKATCDYKLVDRRGSSHSPEFVYKVLIKNKEFPEGCGKTAKEAKQNAARLAWNELQEQSDWSQIASTSTSSPSTSKMSESADDVSSSLNTSKNQTTDDSVVFKDSSYEPEPKNCKDVKPKVKLAANFQNSPTNIKVERPNMNVPQQPSKKDSTGVNPSTKTRLEEDFESIDRIGKGGFGRVYKAKHTIEGNYYAVKIVKFTKKAKNEVKVLSRLNHVNIVRYHTAWIEHTAYGGDFSESFSTSSSGSASDRKYLYIQMEFCEGNTLYKWIDEKNSEPEEHLQRRQEAAAIMNQVLDAVCFVHEKKLIHKDLKPANIMFKNDNTVKIGDFGLVTEEAEDTLEYSRGGGTRSYMSPEQIEKMPYDRKVDIFALGLIYFELVWLLETVAERSKIWNDIREKTFPAQFTVKFDFEHKLIGQMLYVNPEERPEAFQLRKVMEEYLQKYH
ncbi:interferon-induced, double-stranded RNA-activated protein kinase [Trichomycterus rosablanca]|uniref:interferon-induced, double-stranded RNA-activated protein kinase n=1 Tax=Trichomycterus rosablanca TaxID=2290929 RepID=UPI002F356594